MAVKDEKALYEFLTKLMGECIHEWVWERPSEQSAQSITLCKKCKIGKMTYERQKVDYPSWEFFGKLWVFSRKQEWWGRFVYTWRKYYHGQLLNAALHDERIIIFNMIDIILFAEALAKFHGWPRKRTPKTAKNSGILVRRGNMDNGELKEIFMKFYYDKTRGDIIGKKKINTNR